MLEMWAEMWLNLVAKGALKFPMLGSQTKTRSLLTKFTCSRLRAGPRLRTCQNGTSNNSRSRTEILLANRTITNISSELRFLSVR